MRGGGEVPATPAVIRLRDGRRLAYAESGDPSGQPVLYFHGLPSCRLMQPDAGVSMAAGARVFTIDRPGFGGSDPRPGRTLLDWADDVIELADALGLRRFALAGASGGGPFVAACAYRLPGRVTRAALLGASGPIDAPGAFRGMAFPRRAGYLLARHAPALLRLAIRWRGDPRRDPEAFLARYTRHNPPADRALLARAEIRAMFLAAYVEATRQGTAAFAWEVQLAARPWGFRLQDVRVPVTVWHGEADTSTSPEMSQALAAAIPGAQLRLLPDDGHLFFLERWREILEDLL